MAPRFCGAQGTIRRDILAQGNSGFGLTGIGVSCGNHGCNRRGAFEWQLFTPVSAVSLATRPPRLR